jgi:hypothetical protein
LGKEFEGAGFGALRGLAGGLVCAEHGIVRLARAAATPSSRHPTRALCKKAKFVTRSFLPRLEIL